MPAVTRTGQTVMLLLEVEKSMTSTNRQQWITHDLERTTGKDAQQANINAAKAVATALRSTLGPSGRDKMLVGSNGTVIVTNDGASILNRMDIDDPVARIIAQAANTQNESIGDGVTTTVLLVGELLSQAEELLREGLHPTVILQGYYKACSHTLQRLGEYCIDFTPGDDELLQAVAKTAVTGRWDTEATERFSTLATNAVRIAGGGSSRSQSSPITVKAFPGGELHDSELIEGILVDMNTSSTTVEMFDTQHSSILTDARIALVNAKIGVERPDNVDRITIDDPEKLNSIHARESEIENEPVRVLSGLGVDILFCQKSIDDAIRTKLAKENILAIERTRQDEFDVLVRATGATAVESISALKQSNLGRAGSIEQRSVGSTPLLIITDLSRNKQASLLLRGGTKHVAEEIKRIIKNCTAVVRCVLWDGGVLPGGGATETALSTDLREHANTIDDREQLAIKAFANSIEIVPRTLINNAGRDLLDTFPKLRSKNVDDPMIGLDSLTGELQNMLEVDVLESAVVKRHSLTTALETTAMILRIDDILQHTGTDSNEFPASDGWKPQSHIEQSNSGYPWAVGH